MLRELGFFYFGEGITTVVASLHSSHSHEASADSKLRGHFDLTLTLNPKSLTSTSVACDPSPYAEASEKDALGLWCWARPSFHLIVQLFLAVWLQGN